MTLICPRCTAELPLGDEPEQRVGLDPPRSATILPPFFDSFARPPERRCPPPTDFPSCPKCHQPFELI